MKKLFLVLALAFAGIFTANAQVWIGGSASANFKDGYRINVAPEVGYSFNNSPISVAAALNLTVGGADGTTVWGLVASPYVRCNLATVEKFNFFLDLTGDFYLPEIKDMGWRVGLQPGIAWMATEHWTAAARVGFLGYSKGMYWDEEGFNIGFSAAIPTIGLYYNF